MWRMYAIETPEKGWQKKRAQHKGINNSSCWKLVFPKVGVEITPPITIGVMTREIPR